MVVFAFVLRMAIVTYLLRQVPSEAVDYNHFGWESWEMGWTARSIFLGRGFSSPFLPTTGPTALVPPLYPYLLAGMFHLFGLNTIKVAVAVLGLNSLLSALTAVPIYFLARQPLGERMARIACFAWCVYPFSIYFAVHRVWDYALTALLFSCCMVLAQKLPGRPSLTWLAFGALYGLTVMSNPSVTTLLPFLLLIAVYKVWRSGGAWFGKGLLASVGFLIVCCPWTVRNHRVMHADFFMRDGFWLEFYAGNNGDTSETNSSFVHPASNAVEMTKYQQQGEMNYMAEKHDLAVSFVKHHPMFFVVASVRRVIRFWTGYWSFKLSYLRDEPYDPPNVPFCLFLLFCTARGVTRWWRKDREAVLPYLCALLVFPIPYYLTHSSMDYRQPLEPLIVILVSVGLFSRRAEGLAQSEDLSSSSQLEVVSA